MHFNPTTVGAPFDDAPIKRIQSSGGIGKMPAADVLVFMIGQQSAFETPATAGKVLIAANGEGSIDNEVNFVEDKTHGSAWAKGFYPDVYHGAASIPVKFATIDNGVCDMLTSQHVESVAAGQPPEATLCVVHQFTAPLTPKNLYQTVWGKYQVGPSTYMTKVLMDAILSKFDIDFGTPADPAVTAVGEYVGSHAEDEDGSDFTGTDFDTADGSLAYLTLANQCKQLRVQDAFLYVADDAAEINTRFYGAKISLDFDVDTGDDAFKPAGRTWGGEACMGNGCSCTITFSGSVSSAQDFRFPWGSASSGVVPTTTYSTQQPCPGTVPVYIGVWGPSIEKIISAAATEVTVTGTPTNVPTPGGTYTGTATKAIEIIVQTAGSDPTPGTFKWRTVTEEFDGGATSAWTEDVNMSTSPITLEDGITVTWAAAFDNCTADDEYVFYAVNNRHGFVLYIPYAQITQVAPKHGKRLGDDWEIKAVASPGSAPYVLSVYNNVATAYDAT